MAYVMAKVKLIMNQKYKEKTILCYNLINYTFIRKQRECIMEELIDVLDENSVKTGAVLSRNEVINKDYGIEQLQQQ